MRIGNIVVNHVQRAIAALGYGNAVRSNEIPAVSKVALDAETTFVHERVVFRAEQHQVIDAGFAAVRPVLDVVTVQVAVIAAAWEPATSVVSRVQCPLDGLRYDTRFSSDAQWFAILVLSNDYSMAVTTQSFHGLDRQCGASLVTG